MLVLVGHVRLSNGDLMWPDLSMRGQYLHFLVWQAPLVTLGLLIVMMFGSVAGRSFDVTIMSRRLDWRLSPVLKPFS
jgi:hypothetical protein